MPPRPAILVVFLLVAATSVFAGDKPALEGRVNVAIDRGAASLVERQAADGSWNKEDRVHPLGRTALCAFALLHAGYPQDHPSVRKALRFLGVEKGYASKVKPRSTYEASCVVLLLNALGKGHERTIHGICRWLCDSFNDGVGLWGYPDGTPDMSNTQYAALALKVGERHGFKAPKAIWKRLVDSALRLQARDGGFRYRDGTIYRATMTHAALLVLKFAHEGLRTKPPRKIRDAMDRGHRWFRENYSVERNPVGRGWVKGSYYYYMYGLERYAILFGFETIGEHDWYREGAEVLLGRQEKNGRWGNLEETAFAILFLRRATLTEPEARVPGSFENPAPAIDPIDLGPPRPKADVPFLRTWLVAGPFPGEPKEDDHLFTPHLDPKRAAPRAGGPAGRRKWRHYASPEDKVEFDKILPGSAWAAFYAATWIHAERETKAVLWLASDDGFRAYLNGAQVEFGNHRDYCGDDFYRVEITLLEGRNLVLLWVCNLEHYCYFRARLTGEDAKSLDGVRASSSPR